MQLTVTQEGITEKGVKLKKGEQVRYKGHVPGGMVRIELTDGTFDIAHPACFAELK